MILHRRLLTSSAFALLALSASAASAQSVCSDVFVISQEQKVSSARAIVISAPSGGGKTTLMKMLVEEFPELYDFSVSTTTRQPRPGEVNGKDYEFITVDEFKARIGRAEFVEYAEVHGNFYGTSKTRIESIIASGRSPLLLVDVQGADVLRNKLNVPYQTIFVQPPNMKVLEQRLRGRNTDAEEVIQKRLKNAAGEMARAGEFDTVVINDKLDAAYKDLKARVLKPDFKHAPVTKFAWPKDGKAADFEKLGSFATKSMKQELRFTRINVSKDVPWVGLTQGRVEETKYAESFLRADALKKTKENQGRDALDEITAAVARVGVEQGFRFAAHPTARAKVATHAQAARWSVTKGDLTQAATELAALRKAHASLGDAPLSGETKPFAQVGAKIEWPADGYPASVSELATRLVPVYEAAYSIRGAGDVRAVLKKHIEDTLRLGMEQGRRITVSSVSNPGSMDLLAALMRSFEARLEMAKTTTDPIKRAKLDEALLEEISFIEKLVTRG